MLRALKNIRRLLGIARILARHDALFLLEKLEVADAAVVIARLFTRKAPGRPGERLARALEEAGPSFIKLGQALSTRSDLLGEEFCNDLSLLQDRLPPFSGDAARLIIEEELAQPIDALFSSFDDVAIAAASIAQVHFAVTHDGHEVAVKVLRPGIEEAFKRDIDLFFWLAELIEATRPELRRLRPVQSIRTLAASVEMEMDLRFEAAAASELAENFDDDDTFVVPAVNWALTSRRVLSTERVTGIPIDDIDALNAAGHDTHAILEKSSSTFFTQVFRDGFFHADMHPGNMFVRADGALVAVDFGIMGRIDAKTRRHLGELLMAFLTRDYRRAAEVHFEAGWIPADQSVDTFTQACRSIAEPILDRPQNEISVADLLGQLFSITETFRMETQPQLLLLQKTMLTAEGTGRKLDPNANMWVLARPLIEDWVIHTLGPEARFVEGAADIASAMRRLPVLLDNLDKGAAALADGRLRLHPETVRALRGEQKFAGLGWPVIAVAAAVIILSLIL
ncbi:MAG: 2-polyprenylphenol 6-hydroxylase [Rhodospirillaceae bacterium]|jgi:ubiquinone biosynthesis protein|nr:2-polyprenylphenol 6-hydroxylase [Rhodospirillaceae bacterium]MBT4219244.1 2-polyprenylphenol 6-hydroxylase [Rhodospirillaceae bacterium]MBT4463056.1 2-polyprenylphenol 6-hydroxylase [Rhodospirillaceae bacterium]MBT6407040.1 2-polyprenylphenol 6-hydroxylase [Rhodospirillaceae bacterium]MBT7356460.1 2-polyprenylphenol 6-hydroxylase [Rhodospirillaceae bacterium]